MRLARHIGARLGPRYASGAPTPTPAPGPTLSALALTTPTMAENTSSGSTVSPITGKTAASTLALTDDAGGRFALSGTNLVAGLVGTDYEAATSHSITIRETLAGAANTPRFTTLNVAVTNVFEAASLGALTLSATTYTAGTASSGTINGATSGSTIAGSGLPAGLTINGPARTWAWDGTGSAGSSTITLTETLADSANSPRGSSIGVTVNAGADTTAPTLSSPTDAANGSTGATISVSTNEANGTLYWFISTSATPPSAANLKTGTGAVVSGSQAVTTTGVQNASPTGLTASTAYYAHFLHRDAAGNDSAIASGDGFTTAAAGITAPVLTFSTGHVSGTNPPDFDIDTVDDNGAVVGDFLELSVFTNSGLTTQVSGSPELQEITSDALINGFTWTTMASLNEGSTYWWRIRVKRGATYSAASNVLTDTMGAAVGFFDNFTDGVRAAMWTEGPFETGASATGVTVAETGGQLQITPPSSTNAVRYSGYYADGNLTNTSVYVSLVQGPNTASGADAIFAFGPDAANDYRFIIEGGTLYMQRKASGGTSTIGSFAHSTTTHRWLRIRHTTAGDTIYFDTAPSSASNPPLSGDWVNRASETRNGSVTLAGKVALQAGVYQSEASPGTVIFDGFNRGT